MDRKKLILLLGALVIAIGTAMAARSMFAGAAARTTRIPRPLAFLMGLSGLAYLMQGWVVGNEGFSQTMSTAIVLTWVLGLAWMIWLAVVAGRMQDTAPP